MRAIVRYRGLPASDAQSLVDAIVPTPTPAGRDLLISVEATSVTWLDARARALRADTPAGLILGGEGSGTVVDVGPGVTRFAAGDTVWWVGDAARQGSNSEFQLVDERSVGAIPTSLSWGEAAALPLALITAWETLFDRLGLSEASTETLLVVAAASTVGSIMLQLARARLPHVTLIATVGNDRESAWVRTLGGHAIVDSRDDIVGQLDAVAPQGVDWIVTPNARGAGDGGPRVFKPFGNGLVRGGDTNRLDGGAHGRGVASHWDLAYRGPVNQTARDLDAPHVLEHAGALFDAGALRSTPTTALRGLDAWTLRKAHTLVETDPAGGTVVVAR